MIHTAISYLALQQYWWAIIALLGGLLVFLLFVQGGQSLIFNLKKNETEQNMLLNTTGRKWETTFTTLVTFGGAFFASFPLFYATSFGGAYWLWVAILLSFTIQAFSYEYRTKSGNIYGKKFFNLLLWINGMFGPFLLGVAVGSFFNGSDFLIVDSNIRESFWKNNWHGLETLANWHNLALGFTVMFLSRVSGILYVIHSIDDTHLITKARKQLMNNAVFFLVFFLAFTIGLLLKPGFAVNPDTGNVFMEKHKYLHNFIDMPVVSILFLAGAGAVITGITRALIKKTGDDRAFWITGPGIVLVVMSLFFVAGFNNTAFYPSSFDINSSLTIQNASSSEFTLKTMAIVSLMIPFVVGYIVIAWRSINKNKINNTEIEDKEGDTHVY